MELFSKIDRAILQNLRMKVEHSGYVSPNPDSLEIGTPGKTGCLKVYGDLNKPEEFVLKVQNGLLIRELAMRMSNDPKTLLKPHPDVSITGLRELIGDNQE